MVDGFRERCRDSQPTTDEGVPAAWGAIAHTADEARRLIDWDALRHGTHGSATPSALETFDPEKKFVIVLVGVLPYGRSLVGVNSDVSDAHFEGKTVRCEVTSYQSIVSNSESARENNSSSESSQQDDSEEPEYWYEYNIGLWSPNGAREPTSIEVNYHE